MWGHFRGHRELGNGTMPPNSEASVKSVKQQGVMAMALTDVEIRLAKKRGKMSDGRGLYLLVQGNGSKLWRYKYRFAGKEKQLALGQYPTVKLVEARRKHEDARRLIGEGVDPSERKREEKFNRTTAEGNTFGVMAREYIERLRKQDRTEKTIWKNEWLLFNMAGVLEHRPITNIKPAEVLHLLQTVENSGFAETAHRLRGTIGAVFRHAIVTQRAEYDPTQPLKGALVPVIEKPRAAVVGEGGEDGEKAVGRLLASIDGFIGWPTLKALMQFAALTFVRPGEARRAEWKEFKGDKWEIPAARMKLKLPHNVPLSRQALAVLESIRPLTGHGQYVFPSIRSMKRTLSENAMNSALRRLGYTKDRPHTASGPTLRPS
jgi:integrase